MWAKISLGKYIAERRKHMRLTQEKFADKIGVSKSAIAKWETDGGLPDRDNLKRIAEVVGVSADELYRIIERPEMNKEDFDINITPEVVAALESYGYKIIRPGKGEV